MSPLEFERVYQETSKDVRGLLCRLAGENAADDLLQETYIKAWKNIARFNHSSHIKTWLYRIATNTTYDYFRKEKLKSLLLLTPTQNLQATNEGQIDLKQLLEKGLSHLPIKQRVVFTLYYYEEKTIDEISDILQCSPGTVKSRLHHARANYKKFLIKNGVQYE